jgi:predicted lysophospholipase L1 biosynthesis ABC-type transport system permease subunit
LAATIANYGWLPGAIVMSGSEHARLWGNGDATQIGVTFKAGVSRALGKRAVERALAGNSALSVQTAEERRTEVSTVLGSTLSRLDDTTIVVLVATVASVIALMLAAISQHRERLDSLLAIGIGVGQLARLIFYEGAAVLLVGCLLGVAAGLLGQYLIDGWLQHTTGSPVTFTPAWLLGMRTIATAAGLSMLATVVAVIPAAQFHPRATLSVE